MKPPLPTIRSDRPNRTVRWPHPAGRRARRSGGFTLLELLITISILAAAAILAAPAFRDDGRLRLMSASAIVQSDIELAQVLTMTHPEEPVVVRLDPANNRYWLAFDDDPSTPMPREPTGEPYLVVFGEGRARTVAGVTMTLTDVTDDLLRFTAQGGLEDFISQPQITLTLDGREIVLSIASTTGRVSESDIQ
jgi:prepilin-type N-terminal cleavage/methylation domain-containing protein